MRKLLLAVLALGFLVSCRDPKAAQPSEGLGDTTTISVDTLAPVPTDTVEIEG